jgi:tetratricopeptide (TPR) repeat protein
MHAVHALAEAREQGDTWQQAMMTVLLGSIRLWQGRIDEAIERCEEATALFAELGDSWGVIQVFGPKTRALVLAGRFDEAARLAAEVAARTESDPTLDNYRRFPIVGAAAAAVAAGDPTAALAILGDEEIDPSGPVFGAGELAVARGLALVQAGRPAEAVPLLSAASERAVSPGPRGQALAALALALAADGRAADARAAAAEVAAIDGSYLDRAIAAIADGCAAARLGAGAAATDALDRATRIVAGTQDRLTAAVVAVARARVLEVLGDPFAGGAEADARQKLDDLGIEAAGWDNAFRLAAGAVRA